MEILDDRQAEKGEHHLPLRLEGLRHHVAADGRGDRVGVVGLPTDHAHGDCQRRERDGDEQPRKHRHDLVFAAGPEPEEAPPARPRQHEPKREEDQGEVEIHPHHDHGGLIVVKGGEYVLVLLLAEAKQAGQRGRDQQITEVDEGRETKRRQQVIPAGHQEQQDRGEIRGEEIQVEHCAQTREVEKSRQLSAITASISR